MYVYVHVIALGTVHTALHRAAAVHPLVAGRGRKRRHAFGVDNAAPSSGME